MKSIVQKLGSTEFARIRVGIGKPQGMEDLADYVLKKLSKDEENEFSKAIEKVSESVIEILNNGIDSAMNKYN